MTAAAVVATLAERGVALWSDGALLRFRPAAAVTAEERRQLTEHKAAILALLATDRVAAAAADQAAAAAIPAYALEALTELRARPRKWLTPADEAILAAMPLCRECGTRHLAAWEREAGRCSICQAGGVCA